MLLKDAFGEQNNNNYMKIIEKYVDENILPREKKDLEYQKYENKRTEVRK